MTVKTKGPPLSGVPVMIRVDERNTPTRHGSPQSGLPGGQAAPPAMPHQSLAFAKILVSDKHTRGATAQVTPRTRTPGNPRSTLVIFGEKTGTHFPRCAWAETPAYGSPCRRE